jgi:hypothetical protein
MVADLHTGYTGTDLGDDPGTFMSSDERIERDWDAAVTDMLVGMTQPRRGQLHFDLTMTGRVELEFLNLPRLSGFPQHRCLCLH